MTATLISPSGTVLHHRARCSTTPAEEADPKAVRIWLKKESRLEQNRECLKHPNVKAFLRALSHACGAGNDFKHGALKGKRQDAWRFTKLAIHPRAGDDGVTTAAGLYHLSFEV